MTKLLCFDLENTAMLSYHWGRWNQNIQPIATVEESRVMCFGAKWVGGKYIYRSLWDHGREDMLTTIRDLLTEADGVISWNGVRHDSKRIKTEFVLEGLEPPAPWKEIDLMRAVKSQFGFSSNSLDHVSRQLGVGEKVKHEGFFEIIPKVMAGDAQAQRRFAKYQRQDVLLLEDLYHRLLPWLPGSMHPNVALGSDEPACTKCGGTDLERRGLKATATGVFQQYQCRSCGGWLRGSQRVATTPLRPV